MKNYLFGCGSGCFFIVLIYLLSPGIFRELDKISPRLGYKKGDVVYELSDGGSVVSGDEGFAVRYGDVMIGGALKDGEIQQFYFNDFERKYMIIDDNCDGVWDRRER